MDIKIVIVFVVVLELACVSCLSLSRTEINSTVYEVTEDEVTNSLRLGYPKAEKPTLREIIYYHIIETPYEQDQQSADSVASPEDDLNLVPEEPDISTVNTEGNVDANKPAEPSRPVEDDKTINIDPRADVVPDKELASKTAGGDAGERPSSDPDPVGTDALLKSAADADNIKDMGWTDFIKDPEENTRRKREIGGSKSNEINLALKMKTDDEEINKEIDKSEKSVENEDSKEGAATENPSVVEPMQPAKTYGMSLTGDRGTVWNDLNGPRVSYHVGEPANDTQEVTTENAVVETTTQLNLDNIPGNTSKPSDNDKDNPKPDFSKKIEDAFDKINKILDAISKENDKPGDNSNDPLVNEIVDKTKDVYKNETENLEVTANSNRTNETNNDKDGPSKDKDDDKVTTKEPTSSKNPEEIDDTKKDDGYGDQNTSPLPNVLQEIMNNDQFWKWVNDWSTTYLDLMMNRIDNHIKEEVAKQIGKYFAEKKNTIDTKLDTSNLNNETVRQNENDISAKKRKDKDCEGQEDKYTPDKIAANTVYGNSVGNGNVTNIFIFNNNDKSNLDIIKPLVNATNGMYVFGDDVNTFDKEKENEKDNQDGKENKTINHPIESLPNLDNPATVKYNSNPNTVADNNDTSTTDISQESRTDLPENEDVKVNVDSISLDSKENVNENTSVRNDTKDNDDNVDIDQRFGSQETEKNIEEKDDSNKLPAEDSDKEVMEKSTVKDIKKTSLEEIDNNKKDINTPREDKTDISNANADKDNVEDNKNKEDSGAVEASPSSSSLEVERVDKESSEDAPKNKESIVNLSVEVTNNNKAVTEASTVASKELNKINLVL